MKNYLKLCVVSLILFAGISCSLISSQNIKNGIDDLCGAENNKAALIIRDDKGNIIQAICIIATDIEPYLEKKRQEAMAAQSSSASSK